MVLRISAVPVVCSELRGSRADISACCRHCRQLPRVRWRTELTRRAYM